MGSHEAAWDEVLSCRNGCLELTCPERWIPADLLQAYDLAVQGQFDEARSILLRADLYPSQAWTEGKRDVLSLGLSLLVRAMTYQRLKENDRAAGLFRECIEHLPHPAIYNEAACFFQSMGQCSRALRLRQKAAALCADNPVISANLASDLVQAGRIKEGLTQLERAAALAPNNPVIGSMHLCYRHYDAAAGPGDLYRLHCAWGKRHAPADQAGTQYLNDPDPQRRLRVGYVSADFFRHSVAYFFEPILDGANHEAVEITCYGSVARPDDVTRRIQQKADRYRSILGWDDQAVARLIQKDRIDILVDLTGHWRENRLAVFAFQPAPVQVTYLGYPNTTGLKQIAYRLTDPLTETSQSASLHTECLWPMDKGFLCFRPPDQAPALSPLPALTNGYVTYGSFNNNCKINDGVMLLWAQILLKNMSARLVLKFKGGHEPEIQQYYQDGFQALGIAPERIAVIGWKDPVEHLRSYNNIDIALDTFPYNGTTTTCEALWMGVPVVTLAGSTHYSRVGYALLQRVGLDVFSAQDARTYVDKALSFSRQLDNLSTLRRSLRSWLLSSPLCNAREFTRQLETAFRMMWRKWCREQSERALGRGSEPDGGR